MAKESEKNPVNPACWEALYEDGMPSIPVLLCVLSKYRSGAELLIWQG